MPTQLLIASDLQEQGGALRVLLDLAVTLPRDRYAVTVALPSRPGLESTFRFLEEQNLPYERLEHTGDSSPASLTEFRSVLRGNAIELVHLHLPFPGAARWQLAASHLAGIPIVATEHDPFSISFAKRQVKKLTLNWTARTIAISDWAREFLLQEYHLPLERVVRVWNGIDVAPFLSAPALTDDVRDFRRSSPLLLTVAALEPRKGLDTLIEAMRTVQSALPHARLLILGTGSLDAELHTRIAEAGVAEHVQLLGWRDDLRSLLAACDIVVQPSIREAFGLVVVEAMASAKPVIATEVGGHLDTIVRDSTGLLVPPQESGALAAAIIQLARNPSRQQQFGAAGRARVLEQFTRERMAERTTAVYDEVLRAPPA